MKMGKYLKAIVVACVTVACAFGLIACSNSSSSSSGAVAATVNGTSIPEDEVTTTVQSVRTQSGLDTDDTWGEFLVSNSMTPESVREQIIDSLVSQELIKAGAAELGVTVDNSEVDTYVESMKANFDDDAAWQEALKQAGFTEAEYRESISNSLLQQAVSAHFEEQATPSDEEVLESAKNYASYYNGAKRSSHILFNSDDEATAQDVLNRIKSGELDFAEAAKEYSKDSSAENGGDVGWDRATSFVTEYQTALDGLEVDQVSDLVTSTYGIHIIKCTEVFNAPAEITSISDLPEAFQETIRSMAASMAASTASQEWLDGLRESAEIKINDMPADVPYNIDLTKYESAAGSDEAVSSDAEATDEAASGESAEASADAAASDAAASAEASEASGDAASTESASAEASASSESASAASTDAPSTASN